MRIAYFVTKYPYNQNVAEYSFGGASIAARNLAMEMKKKNYDIDIFATSVNSSNSIERDGNLSLYRYGTNIKLLTSNISFGMFWKTLQHNADIAHVHFDIPPGPFIGLEFSKIKKVPLVVTYHGDWVESFGGLIRRASLNIHNKFLVDKLLSCAKVIISPSKQYVYRSRFLKKYKDKIACIPNGVNLDEFDISYSKDQCRDILGLPHDKKIILFFGFLSPYKGPDILVKAMPYILKEFPEAMLVFAGRGIMKEELKILSKNLGVNSNIKFEGFIDNNFKALYYKAADIFCLPSAMATECYPLTILEAMASRLPVIASDIGGIPDAVVNGENGLLVEPNDFKSIADNLILLLKDEDLRIRLGIDGWEKAKNNSWERIARRTSHIYEDL